MSDITMNFGERITEQNLMRLRESLKDTEPGDEITIRIEAADAHHADRITDELERQGFDYQPHGGHEREFYFTARKRMK